MRQVKIRFHCIFFKCISFRVCLRIYLKKMSIGILVLKFKTRVEERAPLGPRLASVEGVFISSLHGPVKIDSLILTTMADYRVEYRIIVNT